MYKIRRMSRGRGASVNATRVKPDTQCEPEWQKQFFFSIFFSIRCCYIIVVICINVPIAFFSVSSRIFSQDSQNDRFVPICNNQYYFIYSIYIEHLICVLTNNFLLNYLNFDDVFMTAGLNKAHVGCTLQLLTFNILRRFNFSGIQHQKVL